MHLTFDSNYQDSSTFGNNGSVNVPANVSFVAGKVGNALKFNGISQRATVTVPSSESLNFTSQLTVAYWVRLDATRGMDGNGNDVSQGIHAIFSKDRDTLGRMYNYLVTGTDKNKNQFGIDVKSNSIPSGDFLGNWVHVEYVISDKTITAYKNGVQVSQTVAGSSINFDTSSNGMPLYIGRFQHNDYYPLNGAIDDFRMYNGVLSVDEIQALVNG